MKIFIGEDDILIAEHLKSIVQKFEFEVVGLAHNKKDIIEQIEKTNPDIVLLDINMEKKYDGIEIGEHILHNYNFPIIYITAHSETATIKKALKTKPSAYIVKPFIEAEIFSAIQIAFEKFQENNSSIDYIVIKDGYKNVKLYFKDILYLQSEKNYIEIISQNKKYTIRESLTKIKEKLNSEIFIRIHRSYIVNIDYVTELKSHFFTISKKALPISRKYYNEAKSQFLKHNK